MSNEYNTIKYPSGRVSHLELKITNTKDESVTVLLNKADEVLVKKYIWNFSTYKDTDYYSIKTLRDGKSLHLGRYLLDVKSKNIIVDCKDKNRLNMRRKNLRAVNRTRNAFNRKMPAHNTSGRMGVSVWLSSQRVPIWTATGTANGIKYSKSFSTAKYGYDEARELAVQFREEFEKEHGVISEKGA